MAIATNANALVVLQSFLKIADSDGGAVRKGVHQLVNSIIGKVDFICNEPRGNYTIQQMFTLGELLRIFKMRVHIVSQEKWPHRPSFNASDTLRFDNRA